MKIKLLTTALFCFYTPYLLAAEAPQMPPSPIEIFKLEPKEIIHGVVSNGELSANRSIELKSEVAGQVAYINLPEGKKVEKGTLLIELANNGSKANLNQATAKQSYSKLKFDRLKTLVEKGIGSQNEKDEAYANLKIDDASVAIAKGELEKTRLTAPFSGILGMRQIDVGDYINPGQSLINLEDTSTLLVDFRIPEKYLHQLKAGQSIEITSEALPGQVFMGEIYAVSPQIDSVTRTLQARGTLPNTQGILRPGLFAKIKVIFEKNSTALSVPEQSVFMAQSKNYVYKVLNQKAILTEVKTGVRENGMVEIISGLSAKDVIAKSGHMRLFDGASVFVPQQKS